MPYARVNGANPSVKKGVRICACRACRACVYAYLLCCVVHSWFAVRSRSRAVVACWVELETALSLLDFACDSADELQYVA